MRKYLLLACIMIVSSIIFSSCQLAADPIDELKTETATEGDASGGRYHPEGPE